MTTRRSAALAATALAALMVAGCGAPKPDVAACKAAMKKDFATALANPEAPSATRPPACNGVDQKTLTRLVGEILAGH